MRNSIMYFEYLNETPWFFNFRLYVVRGKPQDVFPKLFKEWGVTKLTFEVDTEPYAIQRDGDIEKLAEKCNVLVEKHVSHTLYDPKRYGFSHYVVEFESSRVSSRTSLKLKYFVMVPHS